uniref:monogalactosyldiacylglycerol synthase n=1 Tax=Helicotheca tamesis TaxID=374047 RepID=A0A7S2GQZ9_9STRA
MTFTDTEEAEQEVNEMSSKAPPVAQVLGVSDISPTPVEEVDVRLPEPTTETGLKVLFLSSDTGGGHRASAESLAAQFERIFPGSTYALLDTVERDGVYPYNSLVSWYKHLGARPQQWKFVYAVSNSRAFEMMADVHLKLMCERAVRRRIMIYDPDVVVSVHPLMANVPCLSCAKITKKTGKKLPMFTVVTDLGSAHCLWFANGVEQMYVASDQIRLLAKARGKVPDEKLVQYGLPIRHDFAVQAEFLGDRMSGDGKAHQLKVRNDLELPSVERKTVLVMGGGDGFGSLSDIVDALYVEFVTRGIDANIVVVCGRNEVLKKSLEERNWENVLENYRIMKESGDRGPVMSSFGSDYCTSRGTGNEAVCIGGDITQNLRRILSSGSLGKESALSSVPMATLPDGMTTPPQSLSVSSGRSSPLLSLPESDEDEANKTSPDVTPTRNARTIQLDQVPLMDTQIPVPLADPDTSVSSYEAPRHDEAEIPGKVTVTGLGFVTRMAEYMVAADILVSKAGPGTIAEAASLSLPVMLTSFLPGQEEGNVDYVVDGKFGAFCSDADPLGIAEEVSGWMLDDEKLAELSKAAKAMGNPNAAAEIVKAIGDSTWKWKKINRGELSEETSSQSQQNQEE